MAEGEDGGTTKAVLGSKQPADKSSSTLSPSRTPGRTRKEIPWTLRIFLHFLFFPDPDNEKKSTQFFRAGFNGILADHFWRNAVYALLSTGWVVLDAVFRYNSLLNLKVV